MRIKTLFTVPDGEKVTEKALRRVLISSICSILLCMTCLVSTTWAWFTTTIVSTDNVIEIGSFSVAITVKAGETALEDSTVYTLQPNTQYTVTIANTGTSNGYCEIKLFGEGMDAATYSTGTLKPSDSEASQTAGSITFTITVYSAANMEITKYWGDAPGDAQVVPNEIIVGEAPSDDEAEQGQNPVGDDPNAAGPNASEPSASEPAEEATDPTEADGDATESTEETTETTEETSEPESTQE